jgi:hypothetical protein
MHPSSLLRLNKFLHFSGLSFLALGSWFLVLGSWFLALGSWFLAPDFIYVILTFIF